jgi:hypothetical protein
MQMRVCQNALWQTGVPKSLTKRNAFGRRSHHSPNVICRQIVIMSILLYEGHQGPADIYLKEPINLIRNDFIGCQRLSWDQRNGLTNYGQTRYRHVYGGI